MRDGTYTKHDDFNGSQTVMFGHISLVESPATLRLNVDRAEPHEYCGLLGCTPAEPITEETYFYKVTPAGLLLGDGRGEWLYHKVS